MLFTKFWQFCEFANRKSKFHKGLLECLRNTLNRTQLKNFQREVEDHKLGQLFAILTKVARQRSSTLSIT